MPLPNPEPPEQSHVTDSVLHDLIQPFLSRLQWSSPPVCWTEYGTRFDGRAVAVPCSHQILANKNGPPPSAGREKPPRSLVSSINGPLTLACSR